MSSVFWYSVSRSACLVDMGFCLDPKHFTFMLILDGFLQYFGSTRILQEFCTLQGAKYLKSLLAMSWYTCNKSKPYSVHYSFFQSGRVDYSNQLWLCLLDLKMFHQACNVDGKESCGYDECLLITSVLLCQENN